jgi:DNA-binding MarR family transcriptional regulator
MPAQRGKRDPHSELVYAFLKAYFRLHSYPPSQREIALGCHLGKSTVMRCLDRLEINGLITREVGQARSIVLLDPV